MTKFAPFQTARQAALELNLNSRAAYITWHKANNPTYLPRYPNRVYKEFTSWNDWLGTQNVFAPNVNNNKNIRPYWEGVKWAQKIAADNDLNTMQAWIDYTNRPGVEIPDDIPIRPDTAYKEFVGNGWNVWLGKDIRGRLKAARHNTHIFAICSYWALNVPKNYYAFVHAPTGVAEMKQKIGNVKDLVVYRTYYWEAELADQINELFKRFAKDQGDGKMFCPNLNALIFELDMILEWWRPDPNQPIGQSDPKYKIDQIEWSDTNIPSWKVDKSGTKV